MNNIKKNRTGLKLLGARRDSAGRVYGGKYHRFTMNKTQQNQPVYSNVQPRCPGIKGQRGGKDCSGSKTNVGCKSCFGCVYTFDVSSNAFGGAYPSYGNFININPVVDLSSNPPCEWQYNGIVEGFSLTGTLPYNARVQISIEDNKCISVQDIRGVYFYAPIGGNNGTYTGNFYDCSGTSIHSHYKFGPTLTSSKFITTAKRMGAPYRNPIAGWRNSLNCNYIDCSGGVKGGAGTSHWGKQPTNTVYKDNYSGPKSNCFPDLSGCGCCAKDCSNDIVHRPGIQGRTHRPIIRSGMQEKRPCCRDSNGKCNKTNDYSFSYWQYKHNKRCLDYERNQEKYVTDIYPACITGRDGKQHCQNAYRKASCCDCCLHCDQLIDNSTTGLTYIPQVGDSATQVSSGAAGTIISTSFTQPDLDNFTIRNNDCDILFENGNGIIITGPAGQTETIYAFTITTTTFPTNALGCGKAMAKTIYKPSNKKFSHQGAVTSGGRLERLKLDTIKSANSKCIKGKKCITIPSKFVGLNKTYKYPNGKYDAGKPRFTGWMFNCHHSEVKGRVYNMGRYNQQPLGIPQLTAHPPGKTCIKQCFPRTLDLSSNRSTAAGNRARIPGSKCSDCCIFSLYGNSTSQVSDFVPGSIVLQPSTGWTGTILGNRGNVPDKPTWGWLTVRWNGHGICQKPDITRDPSPPLPDHLEIINTTNYFKIQTITTISGGGWSGCAHCFNIPNQTGQGIPCC